MATTRTAGPVIAVVGTGQAGIAALINAIVDIAYAVPDGAPRTTVVVVDSRDEPRQRGDTPYPLGGRSPADLHPFKADTPPTGFPTFGQYLEEQSSGNPGLGAAFVAPTYRQINDYLDSMLELATISFADQVNLELNRGTIRAVEPTTPDGPAVIHFVDGTSLSVTQVIRAKQPPHLGGVSSSVEAASSTGSPEVSDSAPGETSIARLRAETVRALAGSGLTFNVAPSQVLVAAGSRRIAIVTLDLPEAEIGDRIDGLVTRLAVVQANELWIVTPYTASEPLRARFHDGPVKILDLTQLVTHAGELRQA